MEIIIRSAHIVDTGSAFHNQVKDILISNGKIKKIGAKLQNTSKAKEIKADNLHVSLGWFDLNTFLAEPGYEQKETIATGCAAAAFGGFTHICALVCVTGSVLGIAQICVNPPKAAAAHPFSIVSFCS